MTTARRWVTLVRHALLLWRAGQIRFRLETFGVYYPALPYRAGWWRVSPRVVALLLRRAPAYAGWLNEMQVIRRAGPSGWWAARVASLGHSGELDRDIQ
jgi:hypothetical protein